MSPQVPAPRWPTVAQQRAAAQTALAVQLRYAQAGVSLAQAALGGAREFVELRHYPAHDATDPATGTEFYYHAHGSSRRPAQEHGHFHLFKRFTPEALANLPPAVCLPGESAQAQPGFVHIAALSLDARGLPLRWFTTNRWVTGERWLPAQAVIDCLPGLRPRARGRLAPVGEWLNAVLQLHAQPLAALIRRRDRLVQPHQFEDRRVDVLSQCRVDWPGRLARF